MSGVTRSFLSAIQGSGVNFYYRNLLNNLTAYGSGPLVIRIGGNSTDTSTEPTATTVKPFAELAAATGVHFYLGVNLGSSQCPTGNRSGQSLSQNHAGALRGCDRNRQ